MADINDVPRVVSERLNDIKNEGDDDIKNNDVNPRSCVDDDDLETISGSLNDIKKEIGKIVAVLTSSYPIEEGHSEKPADVAMLYIVVFYLKIALSEPDKSHLGFTAEELVDGLKRLAENDANKVSILNAGALPLIENLLETGDVGEKTVAGLTLWSLCFAEENQPKVSANTNIMTSLEKLSNQPGYEIMS